jgi:hypothetical protein
MHSSPLQETAALAAPKSGRRRVGSSTSIHKSRRSRRGDDRGDDGAGQETTKDEETTGEASCNQWCNLWCEEDLSAISHSFSAKGLRVVFLALFSWQCPAGRASPWALSR